MRVSNIESARPSEIWMDRRLSGSNYFVGSRLAKQREKMGRVVVSF
jgi:hypothetical protein